MGLSFFFTHRGRLGEVHSPDEYGMEFETIEFQTNDKLTLRGVWIPAPGSEKVVIILHGHGSSYDFDIYRSPALHEAGFNVLLFDFRAHGRSEGNRMTFGYEEQRDVAGAIESHPYSGKCNLRGILGGMMFLVHHKFRLKNSTTRRVCSSGYNWLALVWPASGSRQSPLGELAAE